jgi:quercetin dioxygenase-like cupin family protein
MKTTLILAASTLAVTALAQKPPPAMTRKDLLAVSLAAAPSVARVEIKTITLGPGVQAGLHLHPCPVVGVVTAGGIVFQIEGSPEQRLRAGDAFFEPANTPVLHFDNAANDVPAAFVTFYLLGNTGQELIRMLKKE